MKKNLVILSGAGMSAESGISTFRDAGGLWDKYPVAIIAKQRNGETGNVYFRHNSAMTKITEYVPPLEYMLKHAK